MIAPQGNLNPKRVEALVKDILAVEKQGYKVILVSSGAIACGLHRLGYAKKPQATSQVMAIASVGQIILMNVFSQKFNQYKRACAQILLTWADFDARERYINIRATLDNLLKMNVVPVINENDAVTSEEIRFGDNDWTSARLADLAEAETLVILSDVEGLYDGKTLVKKVERIDDKIKGLVRRDTKTHTHGGMETKLEAATSAGYAGIKTVIASGAQKSVLSRIVRGEALGTVFMPMDKTENARKRWIFSKQVKGTLKVDDGARNALLCKNKSLLGVGVVKVEGVFHKGDAVAVVDLAGVSLGCGIVNYGSVQIAPKTKLAGELIHHDNFIREAQGWCYSPYRYSAKSAS